MNQSVFTRAALFVGAVCVGAGFFQGCGGQQPSAQVKKEAQRTATNQPAAKEVRAAEAQVYEDEAMLKGSKAVVGGTVENISGANLEGLSVEIELHRRKDDAKETYTVDLEPQNLAPGERGRYSLTVSREWNVARLVRLRSAARPADIAYNTMRGALRPPEKPPEGKPRVVIVPRPKPKGEVFINTPETADRVP